MRRFIILLGSILFLVSCIRENAVKQESPAAAAEEDSPLCLKGEANILLDDGLVEMVEDALHGGSFTATKSASFNGFVEALGITSMERVFPDAGEFEASHREFGLHKWYRIHYEKPITQTKASALAQEFSGIWSWEPVRKTEIDALPFNDNHLSLQWHYYNDGSASYATAGADINVYPVWEHYTTGDSRVIVGVVDGGVDPQHEDLAGQILLSSSKNFTTGSTVINAHEHGTHVGGTIAAINNNGKGVSGIAGGDAKKGNPGVRLISCQIFDSGGGGGSGPDAIVWAADHGAVICNNSWGLSYKDIQDPGERAKAAKEDHEFFSKPNIYPYQHTMKSAIDYFNATAGMTDGVQTGPMAGGLVLFSSGNDTWEYGDYSAYPGVMAVGAIGPKGTRASYSNYGDWVDICAPGGDFSDKMVLSTIPGNGYDWMCGTSMACPHVTGVAALVVSYCGKEGFTRQMLWNRLIEGANQTLVPSSRQIGPLVDALGAITHGVNLPPAPVTEVTASIHSNYSDLSWSITGNNGIPAYGYRLFYGTSSAAVAASTPDGGADGVVSLMQVCDGSIGQTFTVSLADLDFDTTYYGKVYGYDYNLNYSAPSSVFSFTTGSNSAPVFTPSATTTGILIHAFENYQFKFTVSDPEGHGFTVEHTPGSAAENMVYNSSTQEYLFTITGKNGRLGSFSGQIKATDSFGATATLPVSYTVVNEAPVVVKLIEDVLFTYIGEETSLNMADYVSDPDGETLTYTVTNSAPTLVHFNPKNGKLYGAALGPGLSVISLTGTDAMGESVSLSFRALVRTGDTEIVCYPNPVVDKVYLSNAERTKTAMQVKIYSSTGAVVFDGELEASAFDPAVVDMGGCAPGRYSALIDCNGKSYKQIIVKK